MSLSIIKPGLLDTVQDTGRWGYQHVGVNVSGAMDRFSSQLANALLGKELNEPVLEMHFPAAALCFQAATVISLAGADFTPTINGEAIPLHRPVMVPKGAILTCRSWKTGARCYLATLHRWKMEPWLGSCSTSYRLGTGGIHGRPLKEGDTIEFIDTDSTRALLPAESVQPLPWMAEGIYTTKQEVQFVIGNEWYELSTAMQTQFLNQVFTISVASDRMGYRLTGAPLYTEKPVQLVSSAVSFGTIQLLPDGQLIVLMADHQTTGGYPRIGHVITAHLPYLAQSLPRHTLRFAMTNGQVAEEKLITQQKCLVQLQNASKFKIENLLHAVH